MTRRKKMILWAGGGAALLLLALVAAPFIASRVIGLESVRDKLLTDVREQTGLHIEFRKLELSFLPTPRLLVHSGGLTLPGKLDGTVESLVLVPRLLPLFKGELKADIIRLESPKFSITLPQPKVEAQPEPTDFTRGALEKRFRALISLLKPETHEITIRITNGSFECRDAAGSRFWFREVNARAAMTSERLELNADCMRSNLWESLIVSGWVNPRDLSSSGRVILHGLSPEPLWAYLFPGAAMRFGESRLDLDATLVSEGPRNMRAFFQGSAPIITLIETDDDQLALKGGAVQGSFALEGRRLEIDLTRLDFLYPQANLTGRFLRDPAASTVSLELEGRDMGASSVREVALALQGERRVVQNIFEIIQEGQVPRITFSTRGKRMGDLRKPENIVIKGNIHHGKVYIPKIKMTVEDVVGDVVITNNVLEGTSLIGRTGNSRGRDGFLRVGLTKDNSTFHLDILVDADLADLPPVLDNTVKSDAFLQELAIMKNVEGKATGKLILGESLRDVNTRVEVGAFELSGDYARIPYRIDLKGESFLFDERMISTSGFSGSFGKTSFSRINLLYRWEERHYMEITARQQGATISIDEVHPLLRGLEKKRGIQRPFDVVKGTLSLDALDFKGSIPYPKEWVFTGKGSVDDAVVLIPVFPAPFNVKRGRLEGDQETLLLQDCQTRFQDASASVSGSLKGYMEKLGSMDLTFQGTVGVDANRSFHDFVGLPATYRNAAPVAVSDAHLVWEKTGKTLFEANMVPNGGPRVSMELERIPGQIDIRRLSIKDDDSDAFLSLKIREKGLKLGFYGVLSNKTADRLLIRNELLGGWIRGNFKTYIRLNKPMNSTAWGQLEAAGFVYSHKLRTPARIENARLTANGNKLKVRSARVNWLDARMDVVGSVKFTPSGFKLDMDLSADRVDFEKLKGIWDDTRKAPVPASNSKTSEKRKDLKLRGTLRTGIDNFTFGSLSWSPVQGTVRFLENEVHIDITRADLCGIPTPGTVNIADGRVQINLKPGGSGLDLDSTLTCLWNRKGLLSGTFDLKGDVSAANVNDDSLGLLSGNLELLARKGRMYRFEILAKIFTLINFTEIFRGRLPDLLTEGCSYDTIKAAGKLQDGKLVLDNSVVDGSCVRMVWKGEVDLLNRKVNLIVIVAPFRTVDRIIDKVPVVGKLMNGTLISIPVRVTGDLADPTVIPLSPSAVGSGLLGFMKRTFELPFSLLEPFRNQESPETSPNGAPPDSEVK